MEKSDTEKGKEFLGVHEWIFLDFIEECEGYESVKRRIQTV